MRNKGTPVQGEGANSVEDKTKKGNFNLSINSPIGIDEQFKKEIKSNVEEEVGEALVNEDSQKKEDGKKHLRISY